ncbi:MAG: hypothetical protein FD123_1593 [Bacteroidetes bacterium]|nr:MAG: hypothetical protein FD123_1593 [Bacteroidota bacterium]
MRTIFLAPLFFLFALAAVNQQGCEGYKLNPISGSSYGDSTQVSVSMFTNNAPLAKATLAQTVTEGLRDGLQRQTKMELVPRNGDIVFEGSITGYAITPVSIQGGNDIAALNRLTITVSVKFTDTKTEKNSFDAVFTRFADYKSSQNLQSVEDDLIKEITEQLVQDILNRAINNW